jgi:hypothetical protein
VRVERVDGLVDGNISDDNDNDNGDATDDGSSMLTASEKADTDTCTRTDNDQATAKAALIKVAVMQKLCHGKHSSHLCQKVTAGSIGSRCEIMQRSFAPSKRIIILDK